MGGTRGGGADLGGIGWGLVFQGVRDFYHSKFIPAEPNFYHFNMVQSLQLLPAA